MPTLRVRHFQRKPVDGFYSVETLFSDIRAHMPQDVRISVFHSKYPSRGLFRRVYNTLEAACHQSQVNHVTGDTTFLAIGMRKARTLSTFLDCGNLERLHGLRRSLLKYMWFTLPVQRSALITTISNATRDELIRLTGCPPSKVVPIYIPISDGYIASPKQEFPSKPLILHVGITPNKNLERHVAALEGTPCRFRVIGKLSADQRQVLESSTLEWENFYELTPSEMVQQYVDADLLLFCSTYEGFGLPIVEAQAVGRPVITSNLLSMPEAAGGAAILVDPFDVSAIHSAVNRIIDNESLRQRLVAAGFENAKRFRADVIAAEYAKLYRQLAAKIASHESGY